MHRPVNIITVEETYQITNFWKPNDGQHMVEVDFHADSLHGVLSDPSSRLRKTPLAITYPLERQQTIIVHLPAFDWDIPDLATNLNNNVFAFDYNRHLSGNTATYHYAFKTKLHVLPPEDVPKYLRDYDRFKDLLVDTLQRPDEKSAGKNDGINWLMVFLAVGSGMASIVGSIWYWRRTSRQSKNSTAPPVLPSPGEQRLQGLGGWLILVAIGLFLAPVFRIVPFIDAGQAYFSLRTWQLVAMPSGDGYHPLYGPLLAFEVVGNILLFSLHLLALCLFFAKRRAFPRVFIFIAVSLAVFLILDDVGASLVSVKGDTSHLDSFRGVFYALLWSTYMLRSKRVKATFTR